jgi:Outer membrane lipoprotein carrier protein LolA-like
MATLKHDRSGRGARGAIVLSAALLLAYATQEASAASAAAAASVSPAPAARSASADANLVAQIAQRLAGKSGVRAQFRQIQTLAALKAPLISTGSLLFVHERGVIWRVDTPYRATYVIGDGGVAEIDADGRRVARGAQRAGGVAQVSRIMRAILGGDLSALYSQFDVAASGTPAQWCLQLTPNQPQLAQALKGLRMEGGALLQTLTITAANGDTTHIDFSGSELVDAPTAAERDSFGAP